ncbi:FAD-dependent oxidoreductase [Micromonospora sp. WMMD1102]|uniref:FAD-dependent oxidoreductase n=1 Tax=Micromonospora sp. WMMD1102 TaxID=3016105 RepID=UPI00241578AF|nr:FAD-dependent oxidoreductase [Micromonospora sp. WMMD1102]MDG4789144.1 FAD-dependent oxidoreductase [Micromonospora sp. WMMD1102]
MPAATDVVIVGGGLAGLAAARRLHRAGTPWLLVESADRLGGRVGTDAVDGYLIDRGFQVVNTGYPRLSALADLTSLGLGYFTQGVLVRRGGALHRLAHPLRDPLGAARTVLTDLTDGGVGRAGSGVGRLGDRLRLAALAARCAGHPVDRLLAAPETSTETALRRAGLSDRIVEELVRPFLSGVFGERELATSSRVSALIVRSFVRGRLGLPAAGIGAVPAAVAAPLPESLIALGVAATSVRPGQVSSTAGPVRCRAVLVGTDPATATTLLPSLDRVRMHTLTTYYHSTAEPPLDEPILLLDGDRRELVANTVVVSRAAPTYAPAGRHLVATSVAGPMVPPEPVVRVELARLYGRPVDDWAHLTTVTVPAALPAAPPPQGRLRRPVVIGDGVFVAGDHRASPSVQGALASGWRAAGAVLDYLGR